jgi:hypothetical protein
MQDDFDSLLRDPPDPESVYRHYLERCRRLGIDPILRDRAHDLIAEWNDAIAASRAVPPVNC